MATRTEDVEGAKAVLIAAAERMEAGAAKGSPFDPLPALAAMHNALVRESAAVRTILASHAELTAFVTNVAEPHHASDHYSMATAFERFQTRARALLSGKASA